MRFELIDRVVEQSDERILAVKHVTLAEEYLADHFPTFPILPGVMMLETMVQAARRLLAHHGDDRLVLGGVTAMKYGAMVRPGDALEVEVTLSKVLPDGAFQCRGTGRLHRGDGETMPGDATAVAGRFTMRSVRM